MKSEKSIVFEVWNYRKAYDVLVMVLVIVVEQATATENVPVVCVYPKLLVTTTYKDVELT